ncbi:hypothetical protein DL98DRAFT_597444 [Cadophora sp. DSE1049]|nr:hypothetical protein DL98DRAFT_597444 [Cadophora sp. DSE1049]
MATTLTLYTLYFRLSHYDMNSTARLGWVTLLQDPFPENFGARLKELLPKESEIYGSFHRSNPHVKVATILVRFANKDVWRKWVLDGFAKPVDTNDEEVESLWEDYGEHLFRIAANLEQHWDKCPGWAKAARDTWGDEKCEVETPKHFLKIYTWHTGPETTETAEEFLKERRSRIDGIVKANVDYWNPTSGFGQRF